MYMDGNLPRVVLGIYEEIDQRIERLRRESGISCLPGCGSCCESRKVEATVLEALPLAQEVYRRKEEEAVFQRLREKEDDEDLRCLFYRPSSGAVEGGDCSCYPFRPLVCRLFGFAARRNKRGLLEFSPCGLLRIKNADGFGRALAKLSMGMDVPVYQESFIRIASLNPMLGYRLMPINSAVRQAMECLYWQSARFHEARAFEAVGVLGGIKPRKRFG